MTPDKLVVQAEFAAKIADLVLEQLAQRLDQLHVHPLGQAADIVVRLDGDARSAGKGHALDHIGIERALCQEIRAADPGGFLVEHLDKFAADKLALLLRVGLASQPLHKARLGIDHHQRDIIMVAEQSLDLLALVQPQQAMVDKDAGQLVADRLVDQDRRNRAVDAA